MQSNVCNVINASKCHIYSVQKLSIAIAAGRNLAIFKPASTTSLRAEFEKLVNVERMTNLENYVLLP